MISILKHLTKDIVAFYYLRNKSHILLNQFCRSFIFTFFINVCMWVVSVCTVCESENNLWELILSLVVFRDVYVLWKYV